MDEGELVVGMLCNSCMGTAVPLPGNISSSSVARVRARAWSIATVRALSGRVMASAARDAATISRAARGLVGKLRGLAGADLHARVDG